MVCKGYQPQGENGAPCQICCRRTHFAYAPLGYIRHPEVKNTLAIDEETRWIIEKIFDLAFHGAGAAKITKTLIAEKVPTAGLAQLINGTELSPISMPMRLKKNPMLGRLLRSKVFCKMKPTLATAYTISRPISLIKTRKRCASQRRMDSGGKYP